MVLNVVVDAKNEKSAHRARMKGVQRVSEGQVSSSVAASPQ